MIEKQHSRFTAQYHDVRELLGTQSKSLSMFFSNTLALPAFVINCVCLELLMNSLFFTQAIS